MTDHAEEQEMEAEALTAIFDTSFSILDQKDGRNRWMIEIYPETAGDPSEMEELNHVAIQLYIELPETYPDEALPLLRVEVLKGLADDPHRIELQASAEEEAASNEGVPSIFAIAERLREWLVENNRPGMDDISMHAQMMRKQEEQKKKEKAMSTTFESQTSQEEYTAAELEELEVRKRRSEGTPCTEENFEAWKAKFQTEMEEQAEAEAAAAAAEDKKKAKAVAASAAQKQAKLERVSGFQFFSEKTTNLEALEAAAEQAALEEQAQEENEQMDAVDEDLFADDVDVDDLDFDDDEDEEDLDI